MAGKIEARLKELGITLPDAPAPAANYVPFARAGSMVAIAGQLPIEAGQVRYTGLVSHEISVEDATAAARLCALNLIAQAKAAADGDLDRVRRVVQLHGFVACPSTFFEQPKVLNGASDLMVAVFGEAGRHARVAVGSPSLPRNAAVEVAAWFEIA